MKKVDKESLIKHSQKFREHEKLVVFDTETTGLDAAKGDNIIELGGVYYKKNEKGKFIEEEAFNFLIKQDKPLDPKIIEITGITDEMLQKDGVDEKVAYDYFKQFLNDGKTLLIAYNMQFDITFVYYMAKKYNPEFTVKNNILDVMMIYKDFYSFPWKLEAAIERLQVYGINSHRASDDAKATYNLFMKLVKSTVYKVDAYVNVIGYNKKYGLQGEKFPHITYVTQMGRWKKILRMYEGETEFPEEDNQKKIRSVEERKKTDQKTEELFQKHQENPDTLLEKLIEKGIWLSKEGPVEIKDMDKDHIQRLIDFTSTGVEKYGQKSTKWTISYNKQRYRVDLKKYFNGWHEKLKNKEG